MFRSFGSRFGSGSSGGGGGAGGGSRSPTKKKPPNERRGRRRPTRIGRTSLNADSDSEYSEDDSARHRNLQQHYDDSESDEDSSQDNNNNGNQNNTNHNTNDDNAAAAADDEDQNSVYTTITVETVQTRDNTNSKPGATPEEEASPPPSSDGNITTTTNTKKTTQIYIHGQGGHQTVLRDLQQGGDEVQTKVSIYCKGVTMTKDVAGKIIELMLRRGSGTTTSATTTSPPRSWEALAVDLLRPQSKKITPRWTSIIIDDCSSASMPTTRSPAVLPPRTIGVGTTSGVGGGSSNTNDDDDALDNTRIMPKERGLSPGDFLDTVVSNNGNGGSSSSSSSSSSSNNYLDLLLASIIHADNCGYLHLSNLKGWSIFTTASVQSLVFAKSMIKLQLDFITNLHHHVTTLAACLRDNKSITCFIISRCGLDDQHLGIVLSNLPRKIQELRIFGNKCRMQGLAALTAAIKRPEKQHQTSSQHTHTNNNTSKKSFRYYGLLSNNNNNSSSNTTKISLDSNSPYRPLKIIDLSYQHVQPTTLSKRKKDPHGDIFDMKVFAEALCENKTLRVLDLDNDSLDDTQLSYLVKALCTNRTLEELMLNHNLITSTGVALLAHKFVEMKGLKKISMYSNVFDTAEK